MAPLGIQVIVKQLQRNATAVASNVEPLAFTTVDQFLSNVYVMAAIIFISSFLQVI